MNFSLYFAVGKFAKPQIELKKGFFRIAVGWFAFAVMNYDIDYVVGLALDKIGKLRKEVAELKKDKASATGGGAN